MKHFIPFALAVLALSGTISATAAESHKKVLGINHQSSQPMRAASATADRLIVEDFSKFPQGTLQEPNVLVEYGFDRYVIDSTLTNQPGWVSNSLAAVDGAAQLSCYNPYATANLITPRGDYSGTITITCKVHALTTKWNGFGKANCTDLKVIPYKNDEDLAKTDIADFGLFDFVLYEADGWVELTMTFDNYSSDPEGFICFNSDSNVLIDDIKITTSADNFIAAPTILPLTDVTETSFTLNWLPTRKAKNYYIHLFSATGYDENGNPVLKREWPEGFTQEDIDDYEAMVEAGEISEAYLAYDFTPSNSKQTSYTFTDLDPNKEYYYCVQGHFLQKFSSLDNKTHALFVAAPQQLPATNIDTEHGSYTANFTPVAKADAYTVTNYGVYTLADDQADFVLLEEDFSGMDALSQAEGIADMNSTKYGEDSNDLLNSATTLPGWSCDRLGYAKGKAGICDTWDGYIQSPDLYVANGDKVRFSLGVEGCWPGQTIGISFCGVSYTLTLNDTYASVEAELPTNGNIYAPVRFYSADGEFLLDYVVVTQDVAKGSNVYVFQEKQNLDKETTAATFTGLNFADYDNYAFLVEASHTVANESCTSAYQEPRLVNESQASTPAQALTIQPATLGGEAVYYDLTGRRVEHPANGIFVKVQNGKTSKVTK